MRFPHLLISLPVIFCAGAFLHATSPAQAAALDATQATTLLSKSRALDAKCQFLSTSEGEQLKDFVARAEITLAEKASVLAARKALADGRRAGQMSACDEPNRKLVRDVFAAARAAVLQPGDADSVPVDVAPVQKPVPVAQMTGPVLNKPVKTAAIAAAPATPARPKVEPEVVASKPRPAILTKAKKKVVSPARPGNSLAAYAAVVEKYYLARRCNSMSNRSLVKLYGSVLSGHKQAMVQNAKRDIRATVRSAELRAKSQSCS